MVSPARLVAGVFGSITLLCLCTGVSQAQSDLPIASPTRINAATSSSQPKDHFGGQSTGNTPSVRNDLPTGIGNASGGNVGSGNVGSGNVTNTINGGVSNQNLLPPSNLGGDFGEYDVPPDANLLPDFGNESSDDLPHDSNLMPEGDGLDFVPPPTEPYEEEASSWWPSNDYGVGDWFAPTTPYASLPEMFGDTFNGGRRLSATLNGRAFSLDISDAGGSRLKVGQFNKAMTDNRVFLSRSELSNGRFVRRGARGEFVNIDRYLLGFERSILEGMMSVEVRLPLENRNEFTAGPGAQVAGDEIGNLGIIVKGMLYDDPKHSLSVGFGVDTPLGQDFTGSGGLVIENEAVHVLPFLAFSGQPSELLFYHGFVQGDFATHGNTVRLGNQTGVSTPENLLHADFAVGGWLIRDSYDTFIQDLAALAEVHYTTSLQDPDTVALRSGGNSLLLGNPANRLDVVNFTAGLHAHLYNHISVRVAYVTPLTEGADRFFTGELMTGLVITR